MPLRMLDRCQILFGRSHELAVLRDLVANASQVGGAAVIIGNAGTGKTALLRGAVVDARARGFTTAAVSGSAATSFSALYPLLRPHLADLGVLSAAERTAVDSLFADADGFAVAPALAGRALLRLVRAARSDQPILFAVDDLHLLDRASVEAVAEISRLGAGQGVIVIGTTRPGSSDRVPFPNGAILDLSPLDDSASRRLLERHGPNLRYAQREHVLRCAAGNALALVELPNAIGSAPAVTSDIHTRRMPLTPLLHRSFAQGLVELAPNVRDAVLVAAINDESDVGELLAATTVLAGRKIEVAVLDEAGKAGVLSGDDLHVHFSHQLVRSAVLREETLARHQRAHRAIADVLGDGPRRVWHEAQSVAIPHEQLGDELESMRAFTLECGAAAAISLLERAAQLTSQPLKQSRRLLRAADHACALGRSDAVGRLVAAASRHPLSDGNRAHADLLRSYLFNTGEDAARIGALREGARHALTECDIDLALDLLLAAAECAWWTYADCDVRATIDAAAREIAVVADDSRVVATLALTAPVANGRTVIERLERVEGSALLDPVSLRNLGFAAHAIGDSERAAQMMAYSEAECRAQGLVGLLPQVLCVQAAAHVELGDWGRAASLAEEAAEAARGTEQCTWLAVALVHLARANALQGDADRAMTLANQSDRLADQRGLHRVRALARVARGAAWLSSGRHVEAFDELAPLFDDRDARHSERERMSAIMLVTEAAARTDRADEARAIVAEFESVAVVTPSPLLHVELRYARLLLAPDALADAIYRDTGAGDLVRWPWVRARIELAYGNWLRRQRRVVESRDRLRTACATFERIGARSWAEQARSELRAAGERCSPNDGPAPEVVLSPQELEIVRLAAEGLSNREIAQRLFLSHRTVGSHLYRVFPKLGVTSRRQLVTRLESPLNARIVAA